MEDKDIEMMKKIIENNKKKKPNSIGGLKPERVIGGWRKGKHSKKSGGLFDK